MRILVIRRDNIGDLVPRRFSQRAAGSAPGHLPRS